MKLLAAFTKQAFYRFAIYRINFWIDLFSMLLNIYVFVILWNVLYRQSPESFTGVSLKQTIIYAIMGIILGRILTFNEGPHTYITEQVRKGVISSDLMKPLDFMVHMFVRSLGEVAVRIMLYGIIPVIVSILWVGTPLTLAQLFIFLISVVISVLILTQINFLFGLIAFKTLDLTGFSFIYMALIRFLSGQYIPLWFYPESLQTLVFFFPFYTIFYVPMAIFSGHLNGAAAIEAVLGQAAWFIGLTLFARLIWQRVHRFLVIQGG